jgi:4-amino-4-deoxy-L-arabinose transferase-like glycosyltransferase
MSVGFGALLLAQRSAAAEREQRIWMLIAWSALALAVLSKGLIGVVLPGASLFLYSLLTRDWAVWRRLHLFGGLLLFTLIASPWFIAVSLANPEFFRFFSSTSISNASSPTNIIAKARGGISFRSSPPAFCRG